MHNSVNLQHERVAMCGARPGIYDSATVPYHWATLGGLRDTAISMQFFIVLLMFLVFR